MRLPTWAQNLSDTSLCFKIAPTLFNLKRHFNFNDCFLFQDVLRRLSSCLNGLTASVMTSSAEDKKFLDWIIWFCSNIDLDLGDDDSFPPL
jgi:hypothetical protein